MPASSFEPATRANLPVLLEQARAEGALIHDLPPEVTALLTNYGLYTVTEPRDPGTFAQFRETRNRELALEVVAARVGSILGRTSQFADAVRQGVLGMSLTQAFGSVIKVEGNEVHLVESAAADDEQLGIVTARMMALTLADADNADKVAVAVQGLLSTSSLDTFYPVTMEPGNEKLSPTVEIHNLDEHAIRSLSRSVEAVLAQEDKKKGVVLPPGKLTHEAWKAKGETFPPLIEARLLAASLAYRALEVAASYRNRPDLQPKSKPRIIGTDSAAVMEGMRDIMNGLIHDLRGGSHLNLEQHPDKMARPIVEDGIDLRREKLTLKDVQEGVPTSRTASPVEKSLDKGRAALVAARKNPVRTLVKAVAKVPGGISDTVAAGLEYLPTAAEAAKQHNNRHREWKQQKKAALSAGGRLDKLANHLSRIEQGLPLWPGEW